MQKQISEEWGTVCTNILPKQMVTYLNVSIVYQEQMVTYLNVSIVYQEVYHLAD